MLTSDTLSPNPPLSETQENDPNAQAKKIQKIVNLRCYEELTFERFLSTDMSLFEAHISQIEDGLFSSTEFLVEIHISQIPPFSVGKTYEEFRALYKALKLRFPNIRWPEFPPNFQLVKKNETRRNVFNKILAEMCGIARMQNAYKKSLLGLFFAFFLDKSAGKVRHHQNPSSKSSKKKSVRKESTDHNNSSTIDEHNDSETSSRFGESFLNQLEDFDERHKDLHSETSNEDTAGNQSKSYQNNRKLSFDSTPVHQGRHQRSQSFEDHSLPTYTHSHLSPNLPAIDENECPSASEVSKTTPSDTICYSTPRKSGKMSLDSKLNEGPERIVEFSVEEMMKKMKNPQSSSKSPIGKEAEKEKQDTIKESPEFQAAKPAAPENMSTKSSNSPTLDEQSNPQISHEMDKFLNKEIAKFSGDIYVHISSETKWNKYFGKIQNSMLLLYPSILDNFPIHFIPLFRSVINIVQSSNGDYIEFSHHYDAETFQICIEPESKNQMDPTDPKKNLQVWCAQLKIASEKISDLELTDNFYNYAVGKLQLVVCDVIDVKDLPSDSSCFVRIRHKPHVLCTSKALSGEVMKWKQSFFLPITDIFFSITLELVCLYNDGWITESHKEEVIATLDLPVQDILSLPANQILQEILPMRYSDNKKLKIIKHLGPDAPAPKIRLKFNNLSSVKSYFAPPYGDYVDGVKMDHGTIATQAIKLSIARIRRIISYIIVGVRNIRDVYHFKYPFFSYICALLMTYVMIYFEISDLIPCLLFFMTLLCVYTHPRVEARVKPLLDRLFFQESDLNSDYRHPQIMTTFEAELLDTFNTEKWKYKLTDDDSLMTTLKKAKKSVVMITIMIAKISGFFEKLKNIVLWQDHRRSMIFVFCTLVLYCVFAVIPLRFIIFGAVWAKFIKGLSYFRNLRQKNRLVATKTITFIMNKYFPDIVNQITQEPNKPWPVTLHEKKAQRKMVEQLKRRLEVEMPENALHTYKTPEELITALESCILHLKFQKDEAEAATKEMLRRKDPKFTVDNLFYYIMNIPSDYYRVIHPKKIFLESKKTDS